MWIATSCVSNKDQICQIQVGDAMMIVVSDSFRDLWACHQIQLGYVYDRPVHHYNFRTVCPILSPQLHHYEFTLKLLFSLLLVEFMCVCVLVCI